MTISLRHRIGSLVVLSVVTAVLSTSVALASGQSAPDIVGVGYQYDGQKTLLATQQKYPGKKLAQTETECYGGGNAWDQALLTFGHLIEDTSNFASSYFFWNLVLDESGLSRWNWRQNSLLTVDRKTETVIYNPEYYAMKHFSASVRSGARRIAVRAGPLNKVVAFQNSDGSRVLIILNDTDRKIAATLDADGTSFLFDVPAQSMNTLILR